MPRATTEDRAEECAFSPKDPDPHAIEYLSFDEAGIEQALEIIISQEPPVAVVAGRADEDLLSLEPPLFAVDLRASMEAAPTLANSERDRCGHGRIITFVFQFSSPE